MDVFDHRDICEFCGKPMATPEDGEMRADDPRVADFCWAKPENGDVCPVEQARLDKIADRYERDRDREWDDGGRP